MSDTEEKRRIAELEAEVASLKAELGRQGEGGAPVEEPEESPTGGFEPKHSKAKVLMLSAVVVIVGLLLILAIFTALSRGFDRFADKAAERLVPQQGQKAAPPSSTRVVPGEPPPAKVPAPRPQDASEPKEHVLVPGI